MQETKIKKLLLTGIAALFLATGTAHTGSKLPMPTLWRCPNSIVVINPIDPIWENAKTDFVRGQGGPREQRLTMIHTGRYSLSEATALSPNDPCARMPKLDGEPYSLYGLGAFGSQPLRLSLVF